MRLEDMKAAIILLALIAFIGAAVAIAVGDFQGGLTDSTTSYLCGVNGTEQFNITCNGLDGIGNATSYLDTIGTIIGVAVLIGIVVMAFTFVRQ